MHLVDAGLVLGFTQQQDETLLELMRACE